METDLNNDVCWAVELNSDLFTISKYTIIKETKNTYVIVKYDRWWEGEYHIRKKVMTFGIICPKMVFLTLNEAIAFRKQKLQQQLELNNIKIETIKVHNAEIEVELKKLEVEE